MTDHPRVFIRGPFRRPHGIERVFDREGNLWVLDPKSKVRFKRPDADTGWTRWWALLNERGPLTEARLRPAEPDPSPPPVGGLPLGSLPRAGNG